jgi:hypothetical protein
VIIYFLEDRFVFLTAAFGADFCTFEEDGVAFGAFASTNEDT